MGRRYRQTSQQRIKATGIATSAFFLGVLGTSRETLAQSAAPQVTPDNTLDTLVNENTPLTQTNPFFAPGEGFVITGGTLSDSSLFHSFETFSPGTLSAEFNLNGDRYSDVSTIFSRVTGTTPSNLNGFLQVVGGNRPDLFLLNPNGLLIGPSASFNLPGSLFLSTAESLSFDSGWTFSAAESASPPLLTISTPVGLQFGSTPAPIIANGRLSNAVDPQNGQYDFSEITVFNPGTNVTLLGGDVDISNTFLYSASGQIQVGSVGAGAQVNINADTHALTYDSDTAFKDIRVENSALNVNAFPDGSGPGSGNLSLQGRALNIASSNLSSDNVSSEDAGQIDLIGTERIEIENSRVTAAVSDSGVPSDGSGGDINIRTGEFVVRPTTKIGADTYSRGNAGNLNIRANDVFLVGTDDRISAVDGGLASIRLGSNTFAAGKGGNFSLFADNITATGSVLISTTTNVDFSVLDPFDVQYGDGGNILIEATDSLTIEDAVQIGTVSFSNGDAGDLMVRAGDISLAESIDPTLFNTISSQSLTTATYGQGQGGRLTIEANSLKASGITSISSGSTPLYGPGLDYGAGGSVLLDIDSIYLENGASVSTNTFSNGDAGNLTLKSDEIVLVGQTEERSPAASVRTHIEASTFGDSGNGGNLTVNAEVLSAYGGVVVSTISSQSVQSRGESRGTGDSGNLILNVGRLEMRDGSQFSASTFNSGDAGDLIVRATESISISGTAPALFVDPEEASAAAAAVLSTGLFNSSERGATGRGGNLMVETPVLRLSEGAKIAAGTDGQGDSGSVFIRAGEIDVADRVIDFTGDRSGIVATVSARAAGAGGQVDVVGDRIRLTNGGFIGASTSGAGNAGSVSVQAETIDIEGVSEDGLWGSSIESSSGTAFDAGSVTVTGDRVNIRDGGTLSVSSTGGSAGNVNLSANTLRLSNGSIQAEASAGMEGNLNIESRDVLLLRAGSQISTDATATATGGNISIKSPLIVGLENSDITANAVEGDGGSILLATQGLLGLAVRSQLTADSDITASSERGVNGTVTIESPSVEPDSGLIKLPETVEDASSQVAASCQTTQYENQFASTGRGGIPDNPFQLVRSDSTWQDFRGIETIPPIANVPEVEAPMVPTRTEAPSAASHTPKLEEAGQWSLNEKGEVELLAMSEVVNTDSSCLVH